MIKTIMKIDGMMCGMCEAHVCDTTGYTCLGVESAPYKKKGLFGWR